MYESTDKLMSTNQLFIP